MTTIAASTALGRLVNSGARKTDVASTRPAARSDESCERAPADSAVADWDRLASGVNPPKSPELMLAPPSATSSWSRIDLVAMPGREGATGAAQFADGQEDDPEGSGDQERDVALHRPRGRPRLGKPVGNAPTTVTPYAVRSSRLLTRRSRRRGRRAGPGSAASPRAG